MKVSIFAVEIEVIFLSDFDGLEGVWRNFLISILRYSTFIERGWAIRWINGETLEWYKSF